MGRMAKIKIEDLSRLEDLSSDEAKGIFGGAAPLLQPMSSDLPENEGTTKRGGGEKRPVEPKPTAKKGIRKDEK